MWEKEDVESIVPGEASIADNVESTGRNVHAALNTPSSANASVSPVDAETLETAGSWPESPHGCGAVATLAVGDVAP